MNDLDRCVNSEFMRVCKCVVPYLEQPVQKNVAIGLKVLELINTVNFYKGLDGSLNRYREENWETTLLQEIKKNLEPEKVYLIDALIKITELNNILSTKTPTNNTQHTEPVPPATDPAPEVHQPNITTFNVTKDFPVEDLLNTITNKLSAQNMNTKDIIPPKPENSAPPNNVVSEPDSPDLSGNFLEELMQNLAPLLDTNQSQLLTAIGNMLL
ncbi:hypothetical protein AN639_07935 [Candidatus Epulonipiscium fishelsonii]|uniref:Uncharacterized protein n=1 Tax=Candidatus Epulonipiscium fishelsonii TaxID=77094 RepID=A0ACC8X7G7_9FIRM|nr:hypothetical protein AN396_12645 [Epulopiscium sp. SCG-B11WGA-EpuloA1]ONI38319.1 hypothetical protein AN639_07935 [Epulopiscium sp. SCG-B05WGA-EpuloA1]